MTNTEQQPDEVDKAAERLAEEAEAEMSPTGNWEPNTPPPNAAPTGNWEPNTPPPNAAPTGNWEPNTPPPENGTAPAPGFATVPSYSVPPMGAWVYGRQITHLYSTSAYPGVWAFVAGVGWRRLAGSELGRSPLTTLALLAKTNGLVVSYHENPYGQIDELQV